MYRVLIAAQDRVIDNQLCAALSGDFQIDQVRDDWQAYESIRLRNYDGLVLERDLPQFGGLQICRQMRTAGSAAAIFIVGSQHSSEFYESALEHGADHYFAHPVSGRELLARMKAVIRRRKPQGYLEHLACLDVNLDIAGATLSRRGRTVNLRPMEVSLLEFFMRNQDRLFSVDDLWREVWRRKGMPSDTVRAHVNMLRRKLRELDADDLIKTVNGLGYKLSA